MAEKKITDFIAGLYSHEIEQIKNEYNEKIAKTQHDFIEELNDIRKVRAPGFFRGVLQSVLGAVGYSLLIAFIIVILWSSRFGCKHVIESISGYKLVEKVRNNTTESTGPNTQQPEDKTHAPQSSENLSGDNPDNQ